MALSIYDIIKSALISEKAQKINADHDKLVLSIHPKSNKPLVKEAIEKLFDVKVENIRIIVRKGKNRKVGKNKVTDNLQKKAVVKLKPGYTLDLFGNSEAAQKYSSNKAAANKKDIG